MNSASDKAYVFVKLNTNTLHHLKILSEVFFMIFEAPLVLQNVVVRAQIDLAFTYNRTG